MDPEVSLPATPKGKPPGPPPALMRPTSKPSSALSWAVPAAAFPSDIEGAISKLRHVDASQQRYSQVTYIDEPMDQVCVTQDPEHERQAQHQNALYLGSKAGACMEEALQVRNIKFVLSVLHDGVSMKEFAGVRYWRSPSICDSPDAAGTLEAILDEAHKEIDNELAKGHSVLVHCMMGVSRSATVVASYLMQKRGIKKDEALSLLRLSRRVARPNPGFIEVLHRRELRQREAGLPPVAVLERS